MRTTIASTAVALSIALSPVLADDADLTVSTDVLYGDQPGAVLDIYMPTEITDATSVLVFYFGGAWQMGSKEGLKWLGRSLAQDGVIFVAPSYRLFPDARFPTFIDDCAVALGYVATTLTRTDGSQRALFVGGWSAGAYNAMSVALDQERLVESGVNPDRVSGIIGLAGPYSGGLCAGQPCPDIFPPGTENSWPVAGLIDPEDPPLLLMVAERDEYVAPYQADDLAQAARAAEVGVTVATIPSAYHRGLLQNLSRPETPERATLDAFLNALAQ